MCIWTLCLRVPGLKNKTKQYLTLFFPKYNFDRQLNPIFYSAIVIFGLLLYYFSYALSVIDWILGLDVIRLNRQAERQA